MFEDSTFESTGRIKTRSRRWMVAALAFNGSILLALVLIPLIYPEALHRVGPMILMEAPKPPMEQPKPMKPPQNAVVVRSQMPDGTLTAPRTIPDLIPKPGKPEVLEAVSVVNWGDPSGGGDSLANSPFGKPSPKPTVQAAKTGPVAISSLVLGSPIYRTTPEYSPIAKATGTHGTVVLQAVISKSGTIENLRVVSGPPMLQQSALDAVRQWRYRPYLLNGEPIEVETTINVVFTLGR